MRKYQSILNARKRKLRYFQKLKELGFQQRIYWLQDNQHCYLKAIDRFIKSKFKDNLDDYVMEIDEDKLVIKFKEKKK